MIPSFCYPFRAWPTRDIQEIFITKQDIRIYVSYSRPNSWTEWNFCGHSWVAWGWHRLKKSISFFFFFHWQRRALQLVFNKFLGFFYKMEDNICSPDSKRNIYEFWKLRKVCLLSNKPHYISFGQSAKNYCTKHQNLCVIHLP